MDAAPPRAENIGDQIDYSQQKNENIGELVSKTLEKVRGGGVCVRVCVCGGGSHAASV